MSNIRQDDNNNYPNPTFYHNRGEIIKIQTISSVKAYRPKI